MQADVRFGQVWCLSTNSLPPLHTYDLCHMTSQSCPWPWARPRDLVQTTECYQALHRRGYRQCVCAHSCALLSFCHCFKKIFLQIPLPPFELSLKINSDEKYLARSSAYTDPQLVVDSLDPAPPTSLGLQLPRHEAQPPITCRSLRLHDGYFKPLSLGVVCYTASLWQ